jgi:DNA-binding NarL/FixJ family response regulator
MNTFRLPNRLKLLVPLHAQGHTNDEIAIELSLTKHTIEKYVSELKCLLGARDRVEVVLLCRGEKLSA